MIIVYVLGGVGLLISAIFLLGSWTTHLHLVNEYSLKSGWGGYRTFKKWFNNYQWKDVDHYEGSLWNKDQDCEYHGGIIRFDGVGMKIHNPISYIFVVLYVRRYIRSLESNHRFSFKQALPEKKSKKEGYLVELPDGSKTFVTMAEIYDKAVD